LIPSSRPERVTTAATLTAGSFEIRNRSIVEVSFSSSGAVCQLMVHPSKGRESSSPGESMTSCNAFDIELRSCMMSDKSEVSMT